MFRYDLTQTMLKIYKVALILVVSIRVSGFLKTACLEPQQGLIFKIIFSCY